MSTYDSIYKKIASTLEQGGTGPAQEVNFDPARHVSPLVAHELNNILTIVQGYAERLLQKNQEDPALQPQLKLISDAARRAAVIVREATPSNAGQMMRDMLAAKKAETSSTTS
ncbi:MAG TPA: histidine kinase dimerization/phospho-acceptor domain-containing protein [Verrucomicrobiae bacterium]|nr:histidine kinase dimerization/phospho-acceptor domain-containing protein [Verrucomicrobiae bacterium]